MTTRPAPAAGDLAAALAAGDVDPERAGADDQVDDVAAAQLHRFHRDLDAALAALGPVRRPTAGGYLDYGTRRNA